MTVKVKKQNLKELNDMNLETLSVDFKSLSSEQKNAIFALLDLILQDSKE